MTDLEKQVTRREESRAGANRRKTRPVDLHPDETCGNSIGVPSPLQSKIDWRSIAKAQEFPLSPAEMEKLVPILDAVENAFRPLVATIAHSTEPAITLSEQAVVAE